MSLTFKRLRGVESTTLDTFSVIKYYLPITSIFNRFIRAYKMGAYIPPFHARPVMYREIAIDSIDITKITRDTLRENICESSYFLYFIIKNGVISD